VGHKEEVITTNMGQEFTITLESNPTSGYSWIPTFNRHIIKLISRNFKPSFASLVGSSGKDIFTFKPINYGRVTLKMLYKRSWEKQIEAEKIFFVEVK